MTISKIVLATLLVAGSWSSQSFAVELRDATDQQILDELADRLRTGSTGATVALGFYSCQYSRNLNVSLVGSDGREAIRDVPVVNQDLCGLQVAQLKQYRSQIKSTTVIAICDSWNYLNKFSMTASGSITDLSRVPIGNVDACLAQAKSINTGL